MTDKTDSGATLPQSESGGTSDIASEYDAFISYKHGPVDSAAARALQKNLEHFKVPLIAGHKEKRIRRVFLDEGELSATAAFASRIQQALKNSRWLIIVCSPATRNSPWVDLEIESFIKYHDRDHILAVMTSGEPADIFPRAFVGSGNLPDEMLAADARGETAAEVVKKLKGDTLLRIAAPIMGMTYDDLKQRHRVYQLQRFSAVATLCLLAITGFLVYASLQNRKLSQFNRNLRLRQSEIVTEEASEQLARGETLQAVNGLLSAITELSGAEFSDGRLLNADSGDVDILPASQYDLTNALNLYKPDLTPNYGEDHITACALLKSRELLSPDLLSDSDGKYLLAAGSSCVYVWDTDTNELFREIPFGETVINWSADALSGNNRIILCGQHNVVCYDYSTGDVCWNTLVLDPVMSVARSKTGDAVTPQTDVLYLLSNTSLTVLNASDGSVLSENMLTAVYADEAEAADTEFSVEYPGKMILSEDGRYLLFVSGESTTAPMVYACTIPGDNSRSGGESQQNPAEEPAGDNSRSGGESQPGGESPRPQVTVIGEAESGSGYYMALASYADPGGKGEHVLFAKLGERDGAYVCTLTSVLIDAGQGPISAAKEWENGYPLTRQQVYTGSVSSAGDNGGAVTILPGYKRDGKPDSIAFGCYTGLYLLDPATGKEVGKKQLTDTILDLSENLGFCIVYTKSGNLYGYDGESLLNLSNAFPQNCIDIEKLSGQNIFFCLKNRKEITRYSPDTPDSNYTVLGSTDSALPSELVFQDEDWTVLRDINTLYWISEKDDTLMSALFTDLIREKDPMGDGGTAETMDPVGDGGTEETMDPMGDDGTAETMDPALSAGTIRFLYLEDGVLHFAGTTPAENGGTVVCRYKLDLSNTKVTRDDLFKVDYNYYDLNTHLLFDPVGHILYVIDSGSATSVIWTYELDTGKAVQHVAPIGLSCICYRLSPDGSRMLLTSDMDLVVIDTASFETVFTVSLSDYSQSAVDMLSRSPENGMIAWDGQNLVVPDSNKLRVYDASGKETHTVPCTDSGSAGSSGPFLCPALSPDGLYLYYISDWTLTQYSLAEARTVNTIELPSGFISYEPWTVSFDAAQDSGFSFVSLFGKKQNAGSDTMRILYSGNYYSIRTDPDAFGLLANVSDAVAFNPSTAKIYLSVNNSQTFMHDNLYYREYSIEEIVRISDSKYKKRE